MTDTVVAQEPDRPVRGLEGLGGTERTNSGTSLAWLFGTTALVGAALLFTVQPMVAKLVLPSYGGSATVWSTSSLFFQVLLLAGYIYTHLSTTRLSRRWQPRVHLFVLALPLLVLPVALPSSAAPDVDASPVWWLLRTLALVIGLPFVVVSTTGPLLQRWYSWTDSRRSDDPYFLFAASNFGSFGGLLAYPFVIEPHLTLDQQRLFWSSGFVLFAVLMALCGVAAGRRRDAAVTAAEHTPARATRPSWRRLTYWTALAFLPSAMMLAVTAHLSTDVAPIPLLWVVPLAIYLATFVVAFARTSRAPQILVTRLAVALAVVAGLASTLTDQVPVLASVLVNLAMLALLAYAAHARLAADRPDPTQLTMFYLVVAVGGALGGLLNGVIAPIAFDRVWEYPLALVAAPLLLVGLVTPRANWFTRRYHPVFVTACIVPTLVIGFAGGIALIGDSASRSAIAVTAAFAVCTALSFLGTRRTLALSLSLVIGFAALSAYDSASVLQRTRTFYGNYTIEDRDGLHVLVHGTTAHGSQYTDPAKSAQPTTYYVSDGPLGDTFRSREFTDVGVVGLGAGTMAAYGTSGQSMTFYEIDDEIIGLAKDERFFTYLQDSPAEITTWAGDGRLLLAKEPKASFDLLVIDGFNSDSIPVHLLTREAFRIYADRLRSDGVLVLHISNRVFDLEPVAAAASLGLGWRAVIGEGGSGDGAARSRWVVLSEDREVLAKLNEADGWRDVELSQPVVWTDDYSSILDVLRH